LELRSLSHPAACQHSGSNVAMRSWYGQNFFENSFEQIYSIKQRKKQRQQRGINGRRMLNALPAGQAAGSNKLEIS